MNWNIDIWRTNCWKFYPRYKKENQNSKQKKLKLIDLEQESEEEL